MPKYMTVHTFAAGLLTPERIEEIAHAGQQDPDVRGYRSFHSLSEGRIVWLLDAPDRQSVQEWCVRQGLPLDSITQLELEGHVGVIRKEGE
jgi:Protein of unknown function (DUF4242)